MLTALSMTTTEPSTEPLKDENVQRITISLERLQSNFIVSMHELLGNNKEDGTKDADNDDAEAEVEGADMDALSAGEDDNEERVNEAAGDVADGEDGEKSKKKKKKRSAQRKAPKVEDYDVDDPFIDDSEVGAVYESVFDLMMRGGGPGEEEEVSGEEDEFIEDGLTVRDRSTAHSKRAITMKDFYVYRGPIEVEVVEKYSVLYMYIDNP